MLPEGGPWSEGSRWTRSHQALGEDLGEDLQDPRTVSLRHTVAGTWYHVTFFSLQLMHVRRSHVVLSKELWLLTAPNQFAWGTAEGQGR